MESLFELAMVEARSVKAAAGRTDQGSLGLLRVPVEVEEEAENATGSDEALGRV